MGFLERRAQKFRKNGRMIGGDVEDFLEKLREEEGIGHEDEEATRARVAEQGTVKEAADKGLLQTHGDPPNSKQHGIFRILCENPNGLSNQITGNHKLAKAIDIKDELEADSLLFCEHRLNLRHKDNRNDFKQMFQRKVDCRAVAAHNTHQNVGRVQEGGTGMLTFGEVTGFISKTGKDPYGLGRWCWTLYSGSNGHKTRVVAAYNACKNKKMEKWNRRQQRVMGTSERLIYCARACPVVKNRRCSCACRLVHIMSLCGALQSKPIGSTATYSATCKAFSEG